MSLSNNIRAKKLAELVVDYSCSIREGDVFLLQVDPFYKGYAELFTSVAEKRGAKVLQDFGSWNLKRTQHLLHHREEWAAELERRKGLAAQCTSRCLIDCTENPLQLANENPQLISEFNSEVIGPYKDVLYREDEKHNYIVRWNIVGFPGIAEAKDMKMSFKDYSDFVYSATLGVDWEKTGEEMKHMKAIFDKAKRVRLYVPGQTDLSFSIEARAGEICAGKFNMPDGELFYGPVEDSMNGTVFFQHPALENGQEISGIRLRFENGKVLDFDARENKSFLEEMLNIPGARTVGEFGIGYNRGIKKYAKNLLFDEKIGGTIHLALGNGCSSNLQSGGSLNKSSLHWDIVCDLRRDARDLANFPGGEIYLDDKLVQKDGEWRL
jgi:aminopeptidase